MKKLIKYLLGVRKQSSTSKKTSQDSLLGLEYSVNNREGGSVYPLVFERLWGTEKIYWNQNYAFKLLELRKECKTPVELHLVKHKTYYVLKGQVEITTIVNAVHDITIYEPGSAFVVPPGMPTSLYAYRDSIVAEISTYDDPHDRVRI